MRWCSVVFVCVVAALGLLALFATPVIGAEWDDPSPPKPQPGDDSSVTSSGGREPAPHVGPPPPPRWRADPIERYWDGAGVKRKHAASHEAGRPTYFLKASLTRQRPEVGPRLVALALIFSALVPGDLADRFLGLTAKLSGLIPHAALNVS